ncbi:peptide synthetase [Streptomyces kunmingensis]|uniref:Phthiocerol/phthiodiolone dimycocerosyl transferase n=1 Tax=Streptomyces kunmingensis TaxID=68225 RepID=A0ABU6C3W4_9ACTN|nr:peptide synthetase [Streptomyces kunmingensis]MEB3958862.1 peptide synthetase [Streptomyces kunmingensis]
MVTTSQREAVRPLGAFERTIDFYMRRNPLQFSLVAEVERHVTEAKLSAALVQLRHRHPLLGTTVDRTAPETVYRKTDAVIPVTTLAEGTPWQAVVAAEQTRPISPAPDVASVRAALVPRGGRCDIVLTFAHRITDGVGGLRALLDLVATLDGEELGSCGVPEALEDLLARVDTAPDATAPDATAPDATAPGVTTSGVTAPGLTTPSVTVPDAAAAASPADDPRLSAGGELAPFSAQLPHLQALALDRGLTARLVHRCREEGTSVHAALCAAAAVVFHRRGRKFVRVLTPMDLRRACGLPDEVVNRFAGAKTVSEPHEADDFWKLARGTRESLTRQRTPAALKAAGAALAEHAPASAEEAEAMMGAATAADIQITNLGVAEPKRRSASTLTALWGPAQITQLRGEHVLGVVTVGGRLRMTELTHDPVAGLVGDIAAVLAEACTEPESPRRH